MTEQGRLLANERMQKINAAYAEISAYYRTHGTLPQFSDSDDAVPAANSSAYAPPHDTTAPRTWNADTNGASTTYKYKKNRFRTILILSLGLTAGFVYLEMDSSTTDPLLSTDPSSVDSPPPTSPLSAPPSTLPENSFSTGSSMQEVLAAQGAPAHIEDNVWHYGQSRVMFSNGAVLSWVAHPDHPLKTRTLDNHGGISSVGAATTFTKGSMMSEVRAIQGNPIRSHDTVWEYGASQVYFKNGRVTSWYESPLAPLKTRK